MLTPNDIKNPKRKSGYNYVGRAGGFMSGKPYFAQQMRSPKLRTHGDQGWRGPARSTAVEAAQDYCDMYNALPNLTPKDIENPKRSSGFDYVGNASGNGRTASWRGQQRVGPGDGAGAKWAGPARSTPLQAAQDYCDYINNQTTFQRARLKTAGHAYVTTTIVRDDEVEAALGVLRDHKAQRAGKQGYVYAITEEGCGEFVKLGYSVNPAKRVAELQTGNPRKLVLLGFKKGTPADERALHAKYIKANVLQEWFKVEPSMSAEFSMEVPA